MADSKDESNNLELISRGQEGVVQPGQTRHPEYACPRARLHSFRNWRHDDKVNRCDLVQNGFYYTGEDDHVRCFKCGIGLHNWQKGDDPFNEHCKRFADCANIMLCQTSSQRTEQLANQPSISQECGLERYGLAETGDTEFGDDDLSVDNMSQLLYSRLPQPTDLGSIPQESPEQLARENEKLRELQTCRMCQERATDVVFMPCGHLVACHLCAFANQRCPLCNEDIQGLVKIYRA